MTQEEKYYFIWEDIRKGSSEEVLFEGYIVCGDIKGISEFFLNKVCLKWEQGHLTICRTDKIWSVTPSCSTKCEKVSSNILALAFPFNRKLSCNIFASYQHLKVNIHVYYTLLNIGIKKQIDLMTTIQLECQCQETAGNEQEFTPRKGYRVAPGQIFKWQTDTKTHTYTQGYLNRTDLWMLLYIE